MSEDHKKQLEQQLWNIANTLRGKMNADEFRDYILGFIFLKPSELFSEVAKRGNSDKESEDNFILGELNISTPF